MFRDAAPRAGGKLCGAGSDAPERRSRAAVRRQGARRCDSGSRLDDIRDVEAEAVAGICGRLIGNMRIRHSDREWMLAAGDIALLAPIGVELWRYERALEEAGLPFSSQAGKNFYRRQEVQDLVALVRALADQRDTIALGALLRGPLLGLTEQELLDVTEALTAKGSGGVLNIYTDQTLVQHTLVRDTVSVLRDLRLRVRTTSPLYC